ncbi:MAG: fused MFS/spermidine synthase [Sedimentisphaerales bacterium]|nr:fused MFS/spermidine synthase [Sedimentisphaerales bacterium]
MSAVCGIVLIVPAVRKAVLVLFLISGATGLIYEVTWTRSFGVVFGNTVFAVSTVLAAFMLGLAVGSWLFGRIADRPPLTDQPLRLYALLEVAIGAYAFAFPTVMAVTDHLYLWFYRSFEPSFCVLTLVRFALSMVILLIPTALMGGTLPVLSKLWADSSGGKSSGLRIGQSVGQLYAVNTFGAVAGSFLAGYFLMRILGVSRTVYLAACANVAVGILAFVLASLLNRKSQMANRKSTRGKQQATKHKPVEQIVDERLGKTELVVLIAVGLAGFCALALEVLWTRILVFVLGTSAYVFACMLTCFILGLAEGSIISTRLIVRRVKRPIFALGVVEFLVALSVLSSMPLLGILWHIDNMLTQRILAPGFWKEVATQVVDAAVVLLVPTILMGMVFPIAVRSCVLSWKAAGKRIGQVYASNTVGCVAGSFAAGFVMVPLLGLRDSFLLVVSIQLLLATAVVFFSERNGRVLGTTAAALSIAIIIVAALSGGRDIFLKTINTHHYPSEIIYIKDDATGSVTVHNLPDGERLIAVDGVDVAGTNLMLRTTQKLQGYIPLLAHGRPEKVLQIGFGSGETSGIGLAFGVEDYRIVEICPAVFDAGRFFEQINRGSYKNPRLQKIIMDGKNFVKLTDQKFDIIMNDATYPGTTGSSALYTYDHFKQCSEKLKPGGMLSCWVPLDLQLEDLQLIIKSFQAVMPCSSLWLSNNSLNKHALLLGTLSELQIDFQRVKEIVERPDISADLAVINIHSVYDFLDCFVVNDAGLQKIAGSGPLNTDDKPRLEFGAAIKRDIDISLMNVLRKISDNHSPILPYLVTSGDANENEKVRGTLQQYFTGTGHVLQGILGILEGDPDIMDQEFKMALAASPQDRDVQSCLDEIKDEIKDLEQALTHTPTGAALRSRLAKRYQLLRQYSQAVEQDRVYCELDPRDARAWNNLGFCYQQLKQFENAVGAFNMAIQYDTKLLAAYVNLATAREQSGDLAQAAQNLERAIVLASGTQQVYLFDRLARAYFIQKKYDLALETLEKAIKVVPPDSELRQYLEERKQHVTGAAKESQR